jgi:hypothetical protein
MDYQPAISDWLSSRSAFAVKVFDPHHNQMEGLGSFYRVALRGTTEGFSHACSYDLQPDEPLSVSRLLTILDSLHERFMKLAEEAPL